MEAVFRFFNRHEANKGSIKRKGDIDMTKKTFWIAVLIGVLLLLVFILASHIVNVGTRLMDFHPAVGIAFYVLALVLVYLLILNPLRVIFLSPRFSIDLETDPKRRTQIYKTAAKRLVRDNRITQDEVALLEANINDPDELPDALRKVFNGSIRKEVDKIILAHSKMVLVTTAISQNGNLDMLSVIIANIRMVRDIVKACGFRPKYTHLAKLSVNVAVTALIAEGLEDVDFSEILPGKAGEAMTDLPMLRTATNSVFQGVSNGMLTCRIGIVTRRFMFWENRLMSKTQLRLSSYKESFMLMPRVITDGLATFPKTVVSFALRPFKKNPFAKRQEASTG